MQSVLLFADRCFSKNGQGDGIRISCFSYAEPVLEMHAKSQAMHLINTCLAVGDLHTDFENISLLYFFKGRLYICQRTDKICVYNSFSLYYDQYGCL